MDRTERVARGIAAFIQSMDHVESGSGIVPWDRLEDEDRDDALVIASAIVDIVDALREPPRPARRVRHGRN